MNLKTALMALASALAVTTAWSVQAQDYPDRPVTLVVPFAPGGAVDLGARNLADGLSKLWDQSVVIENLQGAGSQIGTAKVAIAEPDGYTLLFDSGSFTSLPALRPNVPYDPIGDFTPIASTGEALVVIAAGPKVKAADFQGLVEEASQRKVFYATSGNGSSGHLLSEAINRYTGMTMEPVHYKSGGESLVDVAAGRTDLYVGVLPAVLPFLNDGTVRILATGARERVPAYPDVPTLAELGYDDAYLSVWWGVFGPAGTPEAVVDKVNADVRAVLTDPVHSEFLTKVEARYRPNSPQEFSAFIGEDLAFWKETVAARGIAEE